MNKDEIIMGAGELYMVIFSGEEIPTHEEIEMTENNVGHCQGGFSIDYKPEVYDVKNQYNKIVRRFTIGEEITTKTGILTWDLKRLEMLSTAKYVLDAAKGIRKLVFGGKNPLATVLVRFVHEKENGKKLRWTTIAQGGNGFALEFSGEKELTIDAELASIEKNKGWLGEFEEELTEAELAELTGAETPSEDETQGTEQEPSGNEPKEPDNTGETPNPDDTQEGGITE